MKEGRGGTRAEKGSSSASSSNCSVQSSRIESSRLSSLRPAVVGETRAGVEGAFSRGRGRWRRTAGSADGDGVAAVLVMQNSSLWFLEGSCSWSLVGSYWRRSESDETGDAALRLRPGQAHGASCVPGALPGCCYVHNQRVAAASSVSGQENLRRTDRWTGSVLDGAAATRGPSG